MEAVAESLARGNAAGARDAVSASLAVPAAHHRKEEHALYPPTHRSAGERGRLALVRRMQALSPWRRRR